MNKTVKVSAMGSGVSTKTLLLGKQCENLARQISFDVSEWVQEYGAGEVTLSIMRHGDSSAYAVGLEKDEKNITIWAITNTDTAKAGAGSAELRYSVGESVVISETFPFYVYESDTACEDVPPEPYESWVQTLISLEAKAKLAIENASNVTGRSAYDAAVESGFDGTEKEWLASLIGEKGEKGDTGETGSAGHSPIITASKSGTETTICVDGAELAVIEDGARGPAGERGERGEKGEQGAQGVQGPKGDTGAQGPRGYTGEAGEAGHSPIITASKSGGVTKIFVDGVQIASINDGEKGDTGDKGDKGDKGDTGDTGDTGAQGLQGLKGDAGTSAYESAQTGGYSGTPAQFYADLAALDGLAAALAEI